MLVTFAAKLVAALPPLAPPSCPLVMPPSRCAGWLLRGLHLMLLPQSNATITGLYRLICRTVGLLPVLDYKDGGGCEVEAFYF